MNPFFNFLIQNIFFSIVYFTNVVDAIYQVERLETAYRAAGLPLTSSSIPTHTVSSYLRDRDFRPEHSSQFLSSSSLIPHHDQLIRKEHSVSPIRHNVHFQDYEMYFVANFVFKTKNQLLVWFGDIFLNAYIFIAELID